MKQREAVCNYSTAAVKLYYSQSTETYSGPYLSPILCRDSYPSSEKLHWNTVSDCNRHCHRGVKVAPAGQDRNHSSVNTAQPVLSIAACCS